MAKRDASATVKKKDKTENEMLERISGKLRAPRFTSFPSVSYTKKQSGDLQMRDSRTRCLYDGQAEVASRLRDP